MLAAHGKVPTFIHSPLSLFFFYKHFNDMCVRLPELGN